MNRPYLHLGAIVDVTHLHRGSDDDRTITVGHDVETGQVVIAIDPDVAEQLASVLAQVDTGRQPTRRLNVVDDEQIDPDLWGPVIVDLLTAVEHARATAAAPIGMVPAVHHLGLVVDAATGKAVAR